MKAREGSKIIEKKKSRKGVEKSRERSIEYSTIRCKVAAAFIIFRMCRRESI
jgi:hypothetical protein